jgi:hypothetical protein
VDTDRFLAGIREEQLLAFDGMGAKSILPSIDNNQSMKAWPNSFFTVVRLSGVMRIAPH